MQEQLDALRLPKPVRNQIDDLVRALNAASTRVDVEREGEMQIELIHELQKAKKLRKDDVEKLYILFDDEVQARLKALEG